MKIQLLISTQNKNFDWCKSKFGDFYCSIVNQVDSNLLLNDIDYLKSYKEKGLSKSRNRSLQNASADICVICDDDIKVLPDYEKKIKNAYKALPDADIITFQIITPENKPYKKYAKYIKKHNRYSILKVSSIEISFKLSSIKSNKIQFDERFGLGSIYKGGEENIFLKDALDMGLNIYYYPEPIVIHPDESSNKLINNDFFHVKGAVLKRLYGKKGIFISTLFFLFQLRKIKDYTKIYKYSKIFISGWNSIK
ncbi:glycosyltransferase [Aurantibacter sp.]|uniref:glycosyltransferase family 2 protein n=1 Tax=Aurantibacter sp. TaxID=2807103 RepID=UPI0035C80379